MRCTQQRKVSVLEVNEILAHHTRTEKYLWIPTYVPTSLKGLTAIILRLLKPLARESKAAGHR